MTEAEFARRHEEIVNATASKLVDAHQTIHHLPIFESTVRLFLTQHERKLDELSHRYRVEKGQNNE